MSLGTRFSGEFYLARSPEGARPPAPGEVVAPATEADVPDLLRVAEAVHGPGGRTAALFTDRLRRGLRPYILRHDHTAAAFLWVGLQRYSIYPLRLSLLLAGGAGYVFDEATSPDFRRQGMLGKLFAAAWEREGLRVAVACIATSNAASLAANRRIGFAPECSVVMSRLLALRTHTVRPAEGGPALRFRSFARPGSNPVALSCRLDEHGLGDFRMSHQDTGPGGGDADLDSA
ncbi:MAG: GNAT family N-acetyltransferase [Candidatus Eisenbacteria bacterium]|nr:GNAT family N-acetyltransferase [Candidatus Eisenbacteria bacterium]